MTEIDKRRNAKRREKYKNDPEYREEMKRKSKERYYQEKKKERTEEEKDEIRRKRRIRQKRYDSTHLPQVKAAKKKYKAANKESIRQYMKNYNRMYRPIAAYRIKLRMLEIPEEEIRILVSDYKREIEGKHHH